jgi:NAD/NADP transhydrogenase beta subunit
MNPQNKSQLTLRANKGQKMLFGDAKDKVNDILKAL